MILGGEEYDREMREEIRKKKEAEKKGKGEEKAPKESEEKDAAGTAASQPVQEKDQPEMKDTPKATSEPTVEEKKALVVTVEKPKDAPLS